MIRTETLTFFYIKFFILDYLVLQFFLYVECVKCFYLNFSDENWNNIQIITPSYSWKYFDNILPNTLYIYLKWRIILKKKEEEKRQLDPMLLKGSLAEGSDHLLPFHM